MFLRLLIAFTLVPLVELVLLLRIGEAIGAGATLALVVLTGVVGAWLARREGVRAWANVRRELVGGRIPDEALLHAVLVLVAGVVLVAPGVLTDAAGLLLLVRRVRSRLVARVRGKLEARLGVQAADVNMDSSTETAWHRAPGDHGEKKPPNGPPPAGRRVIEI